MENDDNSLDTDKTARSPVLGSSTFKRKMLKNINSRKRAKLKLSDRFGNEPLFADCPSESNNPNSILKSDSAKLSSENERLKLKDLPMERCYLSTNSHSTNVLYQTVGFKTASGKPLSSKQESSDFASTLMNEFFNPLEPIREKKYNFLSKGSFTENFKSESTKCEDLSAFLGFKVEEYKYSSERVRILHKIKHKISCGISDSIKDIQHSSKIYEKDKWHLQEDDNLISRQSKISYNEMKTIDIFKDDLIASSKAPENMRNSSSADERSLEFTENIISDEKTEDQIQENTNHIKVNVNLDNTNMRFQETESEENKSKIEIVPKILSGFTTGSDNKNVVGSSSVDRLKVIFQDSAEISDFDNSKTCSSVRESNIADEDNHNYHKGEIDLPQFSTASGKKITLTSDNLSKVNGIFKEIINIQDDFTSNLGVSKMYRKKENDIHLKEAKQNHENQSDCEIVYNLQKQYEMKTPSKTSSKQLIHNHPFPIISGSSYIGKESYDKSMQKITSLFSTASGKSIELTSGSLTCIDHIFKEIPNISDVKQNIDELSTSSSTDNNFKDIPDSSNMNINDNEKSRLAITSYFSTASGKSVKLPPSSLSKMEKIFRDIPNIDEGKMNTEGCIDMNTDSYGNPTNETSTLFSTASGKTITLPPSNHSKIINIFKDIPNINDLKSNIEGFSPLRMNKSINSLPGTSFTELKDIKKNSYTPIKKSLINENVDRPSSITNKIDEKVEDDSMNYITPQRSLPKKRRLGSSQSRNGKMSEVAMNKAKSLFGDMNFDDLKLPAHLKFGSPSLSGVTEFTPKKSFQIFSTPQFSSTPVRSVSKHDSFLNDNTEEIDQRFTIQRPNTASLKDLQEELERQRRILEKEIEFVTRKSEAIRLQMKAESSNVRYKLDPQVKKNKFNLKDVKNLEVQSNSIRPINSSILQVNPQNAVLLHFNNNWQNVPTVTTEDGCTLVPNKHGFIGISEIEPGFNSMEGIERNLIPKGWIKNHYRWIVWKLASYKRFFPATLGDCLTVDNVIKQLKYRYIRELYNAERPALRKIYEKDDIPQKKMVLCISNIIKNGDNTELELTDGWYSIRTIIDDPLCHHINKKRVKIGSKLIISGAELLNCEGCHPLELEEARKVRLKINFNSTRRAVWYSKLGYQKDPSPLPIKLSSAVWNGGNIGRVTVYIMRIYPVIYREKMEAKTFWRNQNAEYKRIQEYENECLKKYEDDNNANILRRNVCSLFQMTVIDVFDEIPKPFKCIIWDSNDSHQEQLKENQIVTCFNLTLRCNNELSCSKKSHFQTSKRDTGIYEKFRRKYVALASYEVMLENSVFGEFDTTGFIVKMHIEHNNQYFWLSDLKNNFLLIKINEGPNHCLLLSKVEENYLVAVSNLTLNGSRNGYIIATAGFTTIITQYPQYDFLQKKMEEQGKMTRDDLHNILMESRKVIENFEKGNKAEHSSESEGNTMNFSKVTSTDAVMSMINIDEIVSKQAM